MKVAIIGAGFTGLSAADILLDAGVQVDIFEKEAIPGGLATGFKDSGWDWALEKHYHHVFQTDKSFIKLASKINCPVTFSIPQTSTLFAGQISQLDSPLSLLKFPQIPFLDRLRTGIVLAALKITPYYKIFENITAQEFLIKTMGQKSWSVLWQPLFLGKFGKYADQISAVWFWARIFTRTPSLGYPEGGFQNFAQKYADYLITKGAHIHYSHSVSGPLDCDVTLSTIPTKKLPTLGAVNLVLSLKKEFFKAGTYWLNINEPSFPFLALVEHTHLVSPSHYGGDHLLYIGNYKPQDHKYFTDSPESLIKQFLPYLNKINPEFSAQDIKKSWKWVAQIAQPIVTVGYSKNIPPLKTDSSNYLASIQQVYPWDRGVNYALQLGSTVAHEILKSS